MKKESIDFTRINNDINGNPRYVCHFLELLTNEELSDSSSLLKYSIALKNSRQFGGKKFHNKQYGGGIVFQSYNIEKDAQNIIKWRKWKA